MDSKRSEINPTIRQQLHQAEHYMVEHYHPVDLATQARLLSSGTLATLTGFSEYEKLDLIQTLFIDYCLANLAEFSTWQAAWSRFIERSEYHRLLDGLR